MNDRLTKEEMYMAIAEIVSRRSTCNRLQVGTVITDRDMANILSIGYNGNYKGGPNECDTDIPGLCGDIHSEINALIKCPQQEGRVMFLTDSPCLPCAKAIINAGIETVYFRNEYRVSDGIDLLKEKISVRKL